MKYFSIKTLGDNLNRKLVLIDKLPKGVGLNSYCLSFGERIGELYPENAEIHLSPEYPGIKLSSLLGNFKNCLIVDVATKNVILKFCDQNTVETLPFTLYDHKNKVHSTDYWIVNPVGYFDCINKAMSDIKYLDNDPAKVVSVLKFVFDPKALEKAPHLFRVIESRTGIS